jgi:hypothetical protein
MAEEDSDEILRTARAAHRREAYQEVETRMRRALEGFRRDLAAHPYVQELEHRREPRPALELQMSRGARVAWALGSIAAALLLVAGWLVGGWRRSPPTWAQVAESFKAQRFVSAAIYTTADETAEPVEAELWLARGGVAHMREGDMMVFAEDGKVTKAFDLKTRQPVAASERAIACLTRATSKPEFSLDVILSAITGGRVMERTRLVEPAEVSSADEAVFDIQSQSSPEAIRVWTGLRSRLPTRMRLTNPRTGGAVLAIFSYTKEQHDSFFDPSVLLEKLHSRGARAPITASSFAAPAGPSEAPREREEPCFLHG